jgi:hypothetical protein
MRRPLLLLSLPVLITATALAAAKPYSKKLASVEQNVALPNWQINSREVTPECPTPWYVHKRTLHGGKQEGVELIDVSNGKLRFTIIATRGMGILDVRQGDFRIGWDSPIKDVVHPRHINLMARGGLGWLEGFNEWMVRCGLESNGGAGKDKFLTNTGAEGEMDLTLHGKIANQPAQEVEVVIQKEAPYRITIRGRVDETTFHGPKLELHTEISTEPGSDSIRLADVVKNLSGSPQEFEMLYHTNFGRPLLEEGARFLGPIARVTPFNETAAKGLSDWTRYAAPTAGFVEQVYALRMNTGEDGKTLIALKNAKGNRAVSMAYSTKDLPYTTVWKNTTSLTDGYVTGLEPGTNFPNTRRLERLAGRVPKLGPGGSHAMTIDFGFHADTASVKEVQDRIGAIQKGRQTKVDPQPEVLEPAK